MSGNVTKNRKKRMVKKRRRERRQLTLVMALFVLCAAYLADGSFAPFLYNQY